ncbi:hypothetical protein R5R35_001059 [Gryllus longicercus]|uniref:C2H2-type domain-containing protein n=1 Tax=Gryllus longicercus TaxID=2509291 RepID=A0AAN9VVS7_9ORTH
MANMVIEEEIVIKTEHDEDEPSPVPYSIKQENTDEEELEPPVAVLVEPIRKEHEEVCFKEETDPLAPDCDSVATASIKLEDGFNVPGAEGSPPSEDEDQAKKLAGSQGPSTSASRGVCGASPSASSDPAPPTRQRAAERQCSKALALHKQRHKVERPHPCDVCGKAFTTAAAVALHQRRHKRERNEAVSQVEHNKVKRKQVNFNEYSPVVEQNDGKEVFKSDELNLCVANLLGVSAIRDRILSTTAIIVSFDLDFSN